MSETAEAVRRMQTWKVDPRSPSPEAIGQAARLIRSGGLVAFPTETVYGLGANALDGAAVARIFAAKGRPATNPVIVHVAGLDEVMGVVSEWPEAARRLAERFWPGPLTLVLPRSEAVPDLVTAGGQTVAVRWPTHPVAQALIRAAEVPIAAPSANRSTELSPTRAEHVLRGLSGRIDALLDGGPTPGGIESTVVDVSTSPPRLLRPGLVTPQQLEEVVGPVQRGPWIAAEEEGGPFPSPGMLARHYAPRTPLECFASAAEAVERASSLVRRGRTVGFLGFGAVPEGLTVAVAESMPEEPAAYSALLYDVLHRLDAAGLERIVAVMPPEADEWLAARDRLRRAGR